MTCHRNPSPTDHLLLSRAELFFHSVALLHGTVFNQEYGTNKVSHDMQRFRIGLLPPPPKKKRKKKESYRWLRSQPTTLCICLEGMSETIGNLTQYSRFLDPDRHPIIPVPHQDHKLCCLSRIFESQLKIPFTPGDFILLTLYNVDTDGVQSKCIYFLQTKV